MHWVERGPAPQRLKAIRARYTPRWIQYYGEGIGTQPQDTRWRAFHEELRTVFFGLCAYCEEICQGEVEHFRPKSRFPEQVYLWSNWVFACHDCNHAKGDKWPVNGYVDPCARARSTRPERFFDFDTVSGEILVKANLGRGQRLIAMQMVTDLHLNAFHHLQKRLTWLTLLGEAVIAQAGNESLLRKVAARKAPMSSITRVKLVQMGYTIDVV